MRSHFALVLLLAACTAETQTRAQTAAVERDSNGVRIVENTAPQSESAAQWTLSQQPTIEIGSNEQDSNNALHRVVDAVRLRNGVIVVASGTAPMLRWYDAQGRFVRGTGRPGGGPGEFSGEGGFIVSLWRLPDDSIAAYDLLQRRVQVFDSLGRFARAVTLERGPGIEFHIPTVVGRFADGEIITSASKQTEPKPGLETVRDTIQYVRWNADGRHSGTIARLPGFTRYVTSFWRARVGFTGPDAGPPPPPPPPPPFTPRPVAQVDAERFYYGSGDRYEIAVYSREGGLEKLIRAAQPRRAVTQSMIRAARAALTQHLPPGWQREGYGDLIAGPPHPDSVPAYDRIIVDSDGALWVRDFRVPGEETVKWNVFDTRGRWLTRMEMPAGLEVRAIGHDFLLALTRGSLDVELVRLYALRRAASAESSK